MYEKIYRLTRIIEITGLSRSTARHTHSLRADNPGGRRSNPRVWSRLRVRHGNIGTYLAPSSPAP